MTSRLDTEIKHMTGNHYIFFDTNQDELTRKLKPDTPEYFTWLAGLKSFHFSGKNGHFTARREARKNADGIVSMATYWSAFRRANKKQFRKYLGATEKLNIATLEAVAYQLTTRIYQQPKIEKITRKRPEKREVLYARIKLRDEEIERKNQEIVKLEQDIAKQERTIKEQQASIRRLEMALKGKRERMEL